jgi:hypothetical protein
MLLNKRRTPFGTDLCVAVRETYGKNIGVWRSKSILLASRTGGHATSTLSSKNSFH